jgi:hypothetical protein
MFLEVTMLKKLMISAAIGALMVSGAMAQANPPASPPAKTEATAPSDAKFIAAQGSDQWVFSKFKGTDVIGPDNAKVGDVTDILFDRNGKILGLVVGVGGFLGIGEKSVAIDMSAFQVMPADTVADNTKTTAPAPRNNSPAPTATAAREPDPTVVKLKVSWTKDQLKSAPDFQYFKVPATTTGMSPRTSPAPAPTTPPR